MATCILQGLKKKKTLKRLLMFLSSTVLKIYCIVAPRGAEVLIFMDVSAEKHTFEND